MGPRGDVCLGAFGGAGRRCRRSRALKAEHRLVRQAQRQCPRLHLLRALDLFDVAFLAAVQQKVTFPDAALARRVLLDAVGERARGPLGESFGLRLPLLSQQLSAIPGHLLQAAKVDVSRRRTLGRLAQSGPALTKSRSDEQFCERLAATPSFRPWTLGMVRGIGLADADAVPVGDYHLPNLVVWSFAGDPRGSDERMLELLSVYSGQRFRVIRLLSAAGIHAPRYGPRRAPIAHHQRRVARGGYGSGPLGEGADRPPG